MAVKLYIINCFIGTALLLLQTESVHGKITCYSTRGGSFFDPTECYGTGEYCCGVYNDQCCSSNYEQAVFGLLFFLLIFVCCPVMCYRCCCKRTVSRGIIYHTPQPGTTTNVSVTLPPQQVQQVPYPQQTPYPPQYPTNPYYGMPPPAYGVATQGEVQQASAPNAPYLQS